MERSDQLAPTCCNSDKCPITNNMFGSTFVTSQNWFWLFRFYFINFLWCLVIDSQNQFFPLELVLKEIKKIYFLSKSFLEELLNINNFISKLILTKSIPIKLILSKIINSTKSKIKQHEDMLHLPCLSLRKELPLSL